MNKFLLYWPLIVMVLFIGVGLYLHPIGEEYEPTVGISEEIMALIFGFIAVADIAVVPRILMRNVGEATTKGGVLAVAPTALAIADVPALLGFLHYFMYANIYYFAIFVFVGLATWLRIYRQVEEKLGKM